VQQGVSVSHRFANEVAAIRESMDRD